MSQPLSDEERATLTARLAEADAALHKLLIGGARTVVKYGDQELHNNPASQAQLRMYICDLRGKLGLGGRPRGRRISGF